MLPTFRVPVLIREVYQPPRNQFEEVEDNLVRNIAADNFEWNVGMCPRLNVLCIQKISRNLSLIQTLSDLEQRDIDYLIEILPSDSDLRQTVNLISYEEYWKRCCFEKWRKNVFILNGDDEYWKRTYLTKYIEDYIEEAEPETFSTEEACELATLVCKYVEKLYIKQLQMVKKDTIPHSEEGANGDECIIPEKDIPVDHIPLGQMLSCLTELKEITLVFGVNNILGSFEPRLLKLSSDDCRSICSGLENLPNIKVFSIQRSILADRHLRIFLECLSKMEGIEELNLSHCCIGNRGIMAVAQLVGQHKNLKVLKLCDIHMSLGDEGMQGLAYCLQTYSHTMSLNVLGNK